MGLAGLVLISLVPSLPAANAADTGPRPFLQNQRLGRGVNILGYGPIWRLREQARFQVKHFRKLKEAGFDLVRINLHPFRHMNREQSAPCAHVCKSFWVTGLAHVEDFKTLILGL